MPLASITSQNLLHHAVAVIAADATGNLLLAASTHIEVTAFGHLPAPLARCEYAERLLHERTGQTASLAELPPLPPQSATAGARVNTYIARFSPALLSALSTSALTPVHISALPQLADLHGPILRILLANGILQPAFARFS